jgi:hypothetical protein
MADDTDGDGSKLLSVLSEKTTLNARGRAHLARLVADTIASIERDAEREFGPAAPWYAPHNHNPRPDKCKAAKEKYLNDRYTNLSAEVDSLCKTSLKGMHEEL